MIFICINSIELFLGFKLWFEMFCDFELYVFVFQWVEFLFFVIKFDVGLSKN